MTLINRLKAWAAYLLWRGDLPEFITEIQLRNIIDAEDLSIINDQNIIRLFTPRWNFNISSEVIDYLERLHSLRSNWHTRTYRVRPMDMPGIRPIDTTEVRDPFIDWDVDYSHFTMDWNITPTRTSVPGMTDFIDNYFSKDKENNTEIPMLKPKDTTPVVLTF